MNDYLSASSPFLALRSVQEKMVPLPAQVAQPDLAEERDNMLESVAHLLRLGQLLCTLTEGHIAFFRQEIQAITHGRASLHLCDNDSFSPHTFSLLPLHFQRFRYGYLAVLADENDPQQPALPLVEAHLMAQGISYILHLLEQHLLIQALGKQTAYWKSIRLTRREEEVLSWICKGSSPEEIAEILAVSLPTVATHRWHIYEQLQVHTEYEARLAAYHLGLFSFLTADCAAEGEVGKG